MDPWDDTDEKVFCDKIDTKHDMINMSSIWKQEIYTLNAEWDNGTYSRWHLSKDLTVWVDDLQEGSYDCSLTKNIKFIGINPKLQNATTR